LWWLIAGLPAAPTFGGSATLHPSADTSLFSFAPDNNLGHTPNVFVGANNSSAPGRGLFRFDFTGTIPTNAVIQSAALTVQVVTAPVGGVASVFNLRRVLADWGEGAGTGNNGTAATVGEATWNNRFHPATPWTLPGGDLTNDFAANLSASLAIDTVGTYTFLSNSNLVADVQQWVTNPSTNFGWVLQSESETIASTARRFASREDTNRAPSLTVAYTLTGALDSQSIKSVGNQIQISFLAAAGQTYTAQFRESLATGTWLTLTNIPAPDITTNLLILDPSPTNPHRFYRLSQP
jgi:hypothetical protein